MTNLSYTNLKRVYNVLQKNKYPLSAKEIRSQLQNRISNIDIKSILHTLTYLKSIHKSTMSHSGQIKYQIKHDTQQFKDKITDYIDDE